MDPIEAMNAELERRKAERTSNVLAFRKKHRISDERCLAMIQAMADGKATTIEEAFEVTGVPDRRPSKPRT